MQLFPFKFLFQSTKLSKNPLCNWSSAIAEHRMFQSQQRLESVFLLTRASAHMSLCPVSEADAPSPSSQPTRPHSTQRRAVWRGPSGVRRAAALP